MMERMQLVTVELGLAFHCKTGFNLPGTSRRTALTVARENGWTHRQTNRGAMKDIIAFRRVIEPDYTPSDHVVESIAENYPQDAKKIPLILRKADAFRARLDAWQPGEPQIHWTGI